MQANYISYTEFDPAKLVLSAPVRKQVPKSQPPAYYNEAPIQYNYGTTEQPRLGELLVEWPEVRSNGGISVKDEQGGRKSYSIYVNLPEEGETGDLVARDNLIYASLAINLHNIKGQVGLVNFMISIPGQQEFNRQMAQGLFRPIIDYPRDKLTGNVIQGKAPRSYLRMFRRGFGAAEEKTLFTDLNGTPIHWDLLTGVDMKFIPLIHYEKIYIGGGKSSLQAKVQSAIVTYLVGKNTQTIQTSTIERLTQARPDAVTTLQEQIARLTMDRQDMLLASKAPSNPTGTMQAITDGQQGTPQQQQVTQQGGTTQQQGNFGFQLGGGMNGLNTPAVPTYQTQTQFGTAPTSGLSDFINNAPMNTGMNVGLPQISPLTAQHPIQMQLPGQTPGKQSPTGGIMKLQ